VAVDDVGGTGTLSDATSLVGGTEGYCAVTTSSGVDCWGYGVDGNLGDGIFYTTGNEGSATPVAVDGVGGSGTLSGATNLVGGYCAVITPSGVDCWGYGQLGQLGDGAFTNSATPVEVG
jgi:alpha-tubulin suppressor-like RCC1 family protein